MCGIAGILPTPSSPLGEPARLEKELQRLIADLRHRGPDSRGLTLASGVGLCHTRLAILDLSPSGEQPMASADGRYILVFNGEIYNFGHLRSQLESRGERFRGTGDTEVLLRLLSTRGPEALADLDGMFALACLDTATGEVLLARDRSGQKPLYVSRLPGGGWAFASEIVPLLRVPGVDGDLSPEGLQLLLAFGLAPAPWTLRRGIQQLEPGTLWRIRAQEDPVVARFAPVPGPRGPAPEGDLDALSRQLEAVLADSVRAHLVSDVPVGVLLSGGVDSSVVAALAARATGTIRTFSVVHRDPAYDERDAARTVARAIGSIHHEIELSDAPLSEEELDVLVDHHGDPFADSSSLAVLRLSREMRKHVKVALSGDGADEVFAGYPRFRQLRLAAALGALPRPLRAAGERAALRWGGGRGRQVARILRVAGMPMHRQAVAYTTLFWPEEQQEYLLPEWACPSSSLDAFLRDRGAPEEQDIAAWAHWLEQRLILPDDMLTKVDRMSMATSLEVRPPILGNAVLDLAARLPFEAKLSARENKRVLKAVARRLVPPSVVDRPKMGFAVPLLRHGGRVFEDAFRFAVQSHESPLRRVFRAESLERLDRELSREGEGREPEDSPFRRVHRKWLLALLARTLARHGPH